MTEALGEGPQTGAASLDQDALRSVAEGGTGVWGLQQPRAWRGRCLGQVLCVPAISEGGVVTESWRFSHTPQMVQLETSYMK